MSAKYQRFIGAGKVCLRLSSGLRGVGLAALLVAAPVAASAAPCVADTMTNYRNLDRNGCTVEDKIFRKYFYDSTKSFNGMVLNDPVTGMPLVIPPPGMVQVAPIKAVNPPPFSFNPGLEFSSPSWTVLANESITTTIDYIVEVPRGNPLIKDASVFLRGNAVNGGSIRDDMTVFSTLLTPNSTVLMAFCDGTQASPCVAPGNQALPQPRLFRDVNFNRAVDLVEVHNVLTLTCGALQNCSASVSGLENRFSEVMPAVPELASLWLLIPGLALLFIHARHRGTTSYEPGP